MVVILISILIFVLVYFLYPLVFKKVKNEDIVKQNIIDNSSKDGKPKYKKGDRCVLIHYTNDGNFVIIDDNMIIESKPHWYEFDNHPNNGYWNYPIEGKQNDCPEDLLRTYVKKFSQKD